MQRRAQPEAQIQRAVFQHLRARAQPGVCGAKGNNPNG
jgi:hypothetical protein